MAYFKVSYLDSRDILRMVVTIAISLSLYTLSNSANGNDKLETRCGWFWNPSPANMWLIDRDGEWTIGVMGGHQAEGDWNWPKFKESDWVNTNRTYGYGCACFRLKVDKQEHDVLYIEKSWAKPLNACSSDSSIKTKPE